MFIFKQIRLRAFLHVGACLRHVLTQRFCLQSVRCGSTAFSITVRPFPWSDSAGECFPGEISAMIKGPANLQPGLPKGPKMCQSFKPLWVSCGEA